MPSIQDVFGASELLKAGDLPPGTSVPVVIETVIVRNFDDGPKLELGFRGKQKRLLANKTNCRSIANVLSTEDYTAWPGRTVFLRATQTDFQGRQVDCIRVDENPPAKPASQLPSTQTTPQAATPPVYADTPQDPGGFRQQTADLQGTADVPF